MPCNCFCFLQIWRDNLLIKSTAAQEGAVFSVFMKAMLIFTGGWSKTVTIQVNMQVIEFLFQTILRACLGQL